MQTLDSGITLCWPETFKLVVHKATNEWTKLTFRWQSSPSLLLLGTWVCTQEVYTCIWHMALNQSLQLLNIWLLYYQHGAMIMSSPHHIGKSAFMITVIWKCIFVKPNTYIIVFEHWHCVSFVCHYNGTCNLWYLQCSACVRNEKRLEWNKMRLETNKVYWQSW